MIALIPGGCGFKTGVLMAEVAAHETAAGYDIVLVIHVLSAVVATVAIAVAGGAAIALRSTLVGGRPLSAGLERYYRPGVNWAGRTVMLVPIFGFALVGMSGGQWKIDDAWVSIGLVMWLVVAVVAEVLLWPAERRLQAAVTEGLDPGAPGRSGALVATLCLRCGLLGVGLVVILVAASFLMVAKPA